LVAATVLALVASLAADAGIVLVVTRAFPTTRGYGHFRFSDYATLTAVGVVVAAASWPVVVRISSAPRWLYVRLAVGVTAVSLLPDVWLLVRSQPPRAVVALMVMHVAVAVLTYHIVVRVAPAGTVPAPGGDGGPVGGNSWSTKRRAAALAVLVGVEFALGVATLVVVPLGRPSAVIPTEGRPLYLAHAVLGFPLAVGAAAFVLTARTTRLERLSGWIGGAGVAVAGVGGLLAVAHPVRLLGAALMFVGPMVAALGYLAPAFEGSSAGDP
jgi:hypothetical protein